MEYDYDKDGPLMSRRCLFTNADKLRSMSDEELAEFCVWMCPPGSNENLTCEPEKKLCSQCWLYWLSQEAPHDQP